MEVGGGMRYFRIGLRVLTVVLLVVGYNWRAFRNMHNEESMDAAQLGRNLAEGKGYTTLFVRPFSMYLLKKRNQEKRGISGPAAPGDLAGIKGLHPDLANPPAYPVLLSGFMKVARFHYEVDTTRPFWSAAGPRGGRQFYRYKPDFMIGLFNQSLFFVSIILLFFWLANYSTRVWPGSQPSFSSATNCSGDSVCRVSRPCSCY